MNYLNYIEPFAVVIAAIVAGLFSLIIEFIRSKRNVKDKTDEPPFIWLSNGEKHTIEKEKSKNKPKLNFYFITVFIVLGGLSGYFLASNFVKNAGNLPVREVSIPVTASPQELLLISTPSLSPTKYPIPTPILYNGDAILEINFALNGEGKCNDYDRDRLGYYEKKYYIQPSFNGYVAICHEGNNLLPPGGLQVVAYPETASSFFGYGLLFGWKGSGTSTKDACVMGIRKSGERTEAVYVDWVDKNYIASTQVLNEIVLDDQPHTLRVVFQSGNLAQGYIDGKFFAEHQFTQCNIGPVGMVAWGSGQKIYFDDLKLFEAPK